MAGRFGGIGPFAAGVVALCIAMIVAMLVPAGAGDGASAGTAPLFAQAPTSLDPALDPAIAALADYARKTLKLPEPNFSPALPGYGSAARRRSP